MKVEITPQETELLLELLETEREELQPEIHRTDTSRLRDILHSRLRAVERLSERLESLTEKSVAKK
jgi:hypothetical protein